MQPIDFDMTYACTVCKPEVQFSIYWELQQPYLENTNIEPLSPSNFQWRPYIPLNNKNQYWLFRRCTVNNSPHYTHGFAILRLYCHQEEQQEQHFSNMKGPTKLPVQIKLRNLPKTDVLEWCLLKDIAWTQKVKSSWWLCENQTNKYDFILIIIFSIVTFSN